MLGQVQKRVRLGLIWPSLAWRRRMAFAAGLLCALVLVFAAGECYLGRFPPRELQPYLGDASPLAGPFVADEKHILRYRSWLEFHKEYADRLKIYEPVFTGESKQPVWAFFGNSFVQAPGMLGDTTRDAVPSRTIFYLARNEPLSVRLAQIELLLQNGIKPERIFIVLLPIDIHSFALHGLDQIYINDRGALTWRPRLPPSGLAVLISQSRLALSAWLRTGLHHNVPRLRTSRAHLPLPDSMRADVERFFGLLRDVTQPHGVPETIVLIPNFEQITRGAAFALQDQLADIARANGLDVCDTRSAFLGHPADRRAELFIPDKHFSPLGNRLLLESLLAHLRKIGADPETVDRGETRP